MMPLVDSHCHVDLFPDPSLVLERASNGGCHLVAVTNAPSVFEHTRTLAAPYETVYPAVGLHPQLVSTRAKELPALLELVGETRFIGEIGLDYQTPDGVERRQQRDVFSKIVEACANVGGRVLTVHSRRASGDVLDVLGEVFPGTVILHYFSGRMAEVEEACRRGFYFSVNPAMVKSTTGRNLIARMAPSRILTESDGPFVKVRREPAQPTDVLRVLEHLAEVWDRSTGAVADRIFENFQRAVSDECSV